MGIRKALVTPGRPMMATLVQKAWKAKRIKAMKGTTSSSSSSPQAVMRKKKLQAVAKPKPKEKLKYSPLLSRRFGKEKLISIIVPPRPKFPPPLVWNPPSPTPSPSPPHPPARLPARPHARPPARPRLCKRTKTSKGQI